MAQRASGHAKKPAAANTNRNGDQDPADARAAIESDESNFASLTAGLVRKGEPQPVAGLGTDLFARKGEARPSMFAPLRVAATNTEADAMELRRLRETVAALEATLAAREAASAKALLEISHARERRQQETEDALSRAGLGWKTEAARAQAQEIELGSLRGKLAALQATLADRDAALARAMSDAEATRTRSTAEIQDALSKAEQGWKADTAARLAAAEARWQQKSAKAAVEARAEAERAQASEIALGRLREELTALREALSDRDAALAQAGSDSAETRKRHRLEIQDALLKAERHWTDAAAARLAQTEAQWQAKAAKAATEARAKAERAGASEIALGRLREELTALREALSDRDAALAQAGSDIAETRKRHRLEIQDALLKAERHWTDAAAARFAQTEAQWHAKAAKAAAEARAEAKAERAGASEIALGRLREEIAALQEALSGRETELRRAGLDADRARQHWQQETQDALAKAEHAWKAEAAVRFAASEAQWQQTAAKAVAEARMRAEAGRAQSDQTELRNLREKLAVLRAALADRDAELANARSAIEPGRDLRNPETKIVLRPNRTWRSNDLSERARAPRHTFRDAVIAASLAASAIVFYPNIVSLMPEGWRPDTIFGAPRAPARPPAPLPRAAKEPTAVVVQDVNLRAGPSTATDIVSTLQRGMEVVTGEQRGNWVQVRIGGAGGNAEARQGWVFRSFLKEPGDDAAK